jgi:DNA-binding transcriptional LysR family regulator
MELAQLKYFVTIAETRSFTAAAAQLHLSQPALSYRMKHLENELETRLFDRRGRRITLTPEGELFLPLAQSILLRTDEAVRLLKEHLGIDVGEIHMGCNPTVATYLMPAILADFRKEYPHVRVDVVEADDVELQQSVQQDLLDFAVVTAPGSPQTLEVIHLGAEDVVLIASPGHHIARHQSIALAKLADEDFVLPIPPFNIRVHLANACRAAGFEPKVIYRAGSVEACKSFARQGLGLAPMPSLTVRGRDREGLAVIRIEDGLTRDLNLITGKERSIPRVATALLERVKTSVSEAMTYPARGGNKVEREPNPEALRHDERVTAESEAPAA